MLKKPYKTKKNEQSKDCSFLNTADNMDTTADAVQKAVHILTLNFL